MRVKNDVTFPKEVTFKVLDLISSREVDDLLNKLRQMSLILLFMAGRGKMDSRAFSTHIQVLDNMDM